MGAALLSLIGPILGPLLAAIAALVALAAFYFNIKHKGVLQERKKQEEVRVKEVAAVQQRMQTAISKDATIDIKVTNEIKAIDAKANQPVVASSPDKFRF